MSRLEELAVDEAFLARMHGLAADLDHYLTDPRWYQHQIDDRRASFPAAIAYFSMEFGVTEALPNYSGGLGILAGDHLKSASDLGVPIIGVGLLYRFGYFWQSLSPDGWQQEHYPAHDPQGLPIDRVLGADGEQLADQRADARWPAADRPDLGRPGRPGAAAAAGRRQRGQRRLPAGHHRPAVRRRPGPPDQAGDPARHRRRAGGATPMPTATGHPLPEVFHMNEGHAGFLGLERIRSLIADNGLTFAEALSAVRAGTVFTTHTPVPAGIDRFPVDLVRHYLDAGRATGCPGCCPGWWSTRCSRSAAEDDPSRFNMAHMGLRLAQRANGVAKLHGVVSRNMFAAAVPGLRAGRGADRVGDQRRAPADLGGPGDVRRRRRHGRLAGPGVGLGVAGRRQGVLRAALGAAATPCGSGWSRMARATVRKSQLQRGATVAELGWTESILDPDILTIGFARRVSTYKRLTLMLRDPARLRAILLDPDRPVQIVIAGKAHPADDGGKRYMQEMVRFTDDPTHPAPHRLPARLRHGHGRGAVRRRRRLAEQPDPAAGGVRHLRDEGRAERRAEPVHLRRLVGRAVRRARRLDHPDRRRRRRRATAATTWRRPRCTT